jgi:hypothetical protein
MVFNLFVKKKISARAEEKTAGICSGKYRLSENSFRKAAGRE